jgi:hypothetical protein
VLSEETLALLYSITAAMLVNLGAIKAARVVWREAEAAVGPDPVNPAYIYIHIYMYIYILRVVWREAEVAVGPGPADHAERVDGPDEGHRLHARGSDYDAKQGEGEREGRDRPPDKSD